MRLVTSFSRNDGVADEADADIEDDDVEDDAMI
jgi:hypothetical protein